MIQKPVVTSRSIWCDKCGSKGFVYKRRFFLWRKTKCTQCNGKGCILVSLPTGPREAYAEMYRMRSGGTIE